MVDNERPVIALVATPDFKEIKQALLRQFAYEHLFTLTSHFEVISTGKTHHEIQSFVETELHKIRGMKADGWIANDLALSGELTEEALERWRSRIRKHFTARRQGVQGMIEIANQLVQGRVDAVIQFSFEKDLTVRAGSAVLRREANVHDVPIASDVGTANAFVSHWKKELRALGPDCNPKPLFQKWFSKRSPRENPCDRLHGARPERVLALIAHNKQKAAMTQFVMEHAASLRHFDRIVATGHSGEMARRSLAACGWQESELNRVVLCSPGPEGGDVQIAAAVIGGQCGNVVFFQDPSTSHPHEADIRLFEQAILEGVVDVRFATNAASARILVHTFLAEHVTPPAPMLLARQAVAQSVPAKVSTTKSRQRRVT